MSGRIINFSSVFQLDAENSRTQLQAPIEGYAALERVSPVEETKSHRFSALADGICMGVGIIFILLGVLMPITSVGMLLQGLMSIIVGSLS